jgi:hypothetical protein
MLAPLLALVIDRALADDVAVAPIEPAWVLVERDTPLRLAPSDDAPRVRVGVPDEAPPHRPPPYLILARLGRVDGWLQVRVAHQPVTWMPDGRPAAPDVVPPTWTHCYPQAAAIAGLDAGFWVRDDEVVPVLARRVAVDVEGAHVELAPGLAVSGGPGLYRVVGQHLSVVARIPDDAVADAYPLGLPPPSSQAFVGVDGHGSFVLAPSFRPRVDLSGDAPRVEGTSAGGRTVTGLRDRCVDARLPPTPGALPRGSAAAGKAKWPVLVPEDAAFGLRDGTRLGEVGEAASVLWTTTGCTWTEAEGLCCTDAGGLRLEGAADPALCFDVDLPRTARQGELGDVLGGRSEDLARRAEAATGLRAEVTATLVEARGPARPVAIEAGLGVELPRLVACYQRLLAEDPWLAGTLRVRFPLAPDGRARTPQIQGGDVSDVHLRECVTRRLEAVVVPDQIGQLATIVDLDLAFRGVPSTGDAPRDQ